MSSPERSAPEQAFNVTAMRRTGLVVLYGRSNRDKHALGVHMLTLLNPKRLYIRGASTDACEMYAQILGATLTDSTGAGAPDCVAWLETHASRLNASDTEVKVVDPADASETKAAASEKQEDMTTRDVTALVLVDEPNKKTWAKSRVMESLVYNAERLRVLVVVDVDYLVQLSPHIRRRASYLFATGVHSFDVQLKLYETYGSGFNMHQRVWTHTVPSFIGDGVASAIDPVDARLSRYRWRPSSEKTPAETLALPATTPEAPTTSLDSAPTHEESRLGGASDDEDDDDDDGIADFEFVSDVDYGTKGAKPLGPPSIDRASYVALMSVHVTLLKAYRQLIRAHRQLILQKSP